MSASAADLCALGVPSEQAKRLGEVPVAITCAGTTSGTATTITGTIANLTAAGGATGAILQAHNPGRSVIVNTTSSTSAVVYPPSGSTINGASSLTVAQNKTAIFYYYSTTIIFSILTA